MSESEELRWIVERVIGDRLDRMDEDIETLRAENEKLRERLDDRRAVI